jgi:two-component system NtrC family response regulator
MNTEKLMIVDGSEELRSRMREGLRDEYLVLLAGEHREAMDLFRKHRPRVVLLAASLPGEENGAMGSHRCLEEILKEDRNTKVIVIAGNGEGERARQALETGACDVAPVPVVPQDIRAAVRKAFQLFRSEEEERRVQRVIDTQSRELFGMVGQSPKMKEVFTTIRKIAPSDATVLIQGESGTGKEFAARAIHDISQRREGPFTAINCGDIPEYLLGSELFGDEAGPAAGSARQAQGKIESSHMGSLLLDEVSELSGQLQVRLLRFLKEKTLRHAGGAEPTPVNTRIIATSKRILEEEVQAGRFREDLFYRLCVVNIKLPPLRERREDVRLLATLFLRRHSEASGKVLKGLSPSSIELLETYPWPGNVRELENRIQRAVLLSESPMIEPDALGLPEQPKRGQLFGQEGITLRQAKGRVEKELIVAAIERLNGNIARVAEELEVSRPTLYELMRKHGLYNHKQQNGNGEDLQKPGKEAKR